MRTGLAPHDAIYLLIARRLVPACIMFSCTLALLKHAQMKISKWQGHCKGCNFHIMFNTKSTPRERRLLQRWSRLEFISKSHHHGIPFLFVKCERCQWKLYCCQCDILCDGVIRIRRSYDDVVLMLCCCRGVLVDDVYCCMVVVMLCHHFS